MAPPLHLASSFELFLIVAFVGTASLRWLHRGAWRSLAVRASWASALALVGLGLALWSSDDAALAGRGVALAWALLVVLVPLVVATIVSGALRGAVAWVLPSPPPVPTALAAIALPPAEAGPLISRRAALRFTAGSLPAAALVGSTTGLADANAPQRIPLVRMAFAGLAPELQGLTILHLSDLHLGTAMHVRDLEALLVRAARFRPDLVVLTGDVADHLEELPAALELVHAHRGRLGAFAALGNHEYLVGIRRSRRIYERGPVPLLVDRGVTLGVGGGSLYVAGVDDALRGGDYGLVSPDRRGFYDEAVARCVDAAPPGAFRLLLAHRPAAFPAAARQGFDLTLSGHTHGGQVGLFGRSALEPLLPDARMWGAYALGRSRLYTTSGFGHWFPFRLGCPTEAPLVVLSSS